jgi:hypothetical protein
MLRRVLALKLKGNRLLELPRRKWFLQLPEGKEGEELARNLKGKHWILFIHDPPQNCSVLEEEKHMQVLT